MYAPDLVQSFIIWTFFSPFSGFVAMLMAIIRFVYLCEYIYYNNIYGSKSPGATCYFSLFIQYDHHHDDHDDDSYLSGYIPIKYTKVLWFEKKMMMKNKKNRNFAVEQIFTLYLFTIWLLFIKWLMKKNGQK